MNKKLILPILATLLLVLWLAGSVLAMSSANYRLDWYTPLTGTGGSSSSPGYVINLTVGQSATGNATSPGHSAGLGYWPGILAQWLVRLPVVFRW